MNGSDVDGRAARWWAEWRRRDFSWDGLIKHPWDGWMVVDERWAIEKDTHIRFGQTPDSKPFSIGGRVLRMATLQDYWRADFATGRLRTDRELGDELIHRTVYDGSEAGETHHIAHLPTHYASGATTPKPRQSHDWLGDLIARRLEFAASHPSSARYAQFQGCVLLDIPSCDNSLLAMHCDFAAFTRPARFDGRRLAPKTSFRTALFLEEARFDGVFGVIVDFNGTTFLAEASFTDTTFAGENAFDRAYFSHAPIFSRAKLSMCSFDGTEFADGARFTRATVTNWLDFSNARFGGEANFAHAILGGKVKFDGAEFAGTAVFDHARFEGQTRFLAARFDRFASFRSIAWPEHEILWRGAFDQTLFSGPLAFDSRDCVAFSAFHGARLEHGLTLGNGSEGRVDRLLRDQLRAIRPAAGDREGEIELGLHALESGCRVLKQAMALQSDKSREQMFYRYELIARRRQRATPISERCLSWIYDLTSGYGTSIGRPLVGLILLVAAFALAYWLAAGLKAPLDALDFSASRVMPFGAFEDVSTEWIAGFEQGRGSLATLGIRILASLQSVIAVALVFVFGLAVRRKFQIS